MNTMTNTLPALNTSFNAKGPGSRFSGLDYTCASFTEEALKEAFADGGYLFGSAKTVQELKAFQATITAAGTAYTGRFLFGYVARDIGTALCGDSLEAYCNRNTMELLLVRCPQSADEFMRLISDLAYGRFTGHMVHLTNVTGLELAWAEDAGCEVRGEGLGLYSKSDMGAMVEMGLAHSALSI